MRRPAAAACRTRLGVTLAVGALAVSTPLGGGVAASASAGDVTVSAVRPVDLVGDGGQVAVHVRVEVEGGGNLARGVAVDYRTSGGTATAGTDYQPYRGRLVFPAGTSSGAVESFVLTTMATAGAETAETVEVDLEPDAGATLRGPDPKVVVNAHGLPYLRSDLPVRERVSDLLGRMSLEEKVGQMTQAERAAVDAQQEKIATFHLGSLLSGGGSTPASNTPQAWADMVDGYQRQALSTRLQVPLIYGVDSVHGHGNLRGATLFPHNIGLGATRDPALVRAASHVTAAETRATGIPWVFAPCLCVARDTRWGRTYESYGEDPALVVPLETSIDGLQGRRTSDFRNPDRVLASAKHFAGDGDTEYGSGRNAAGALGSDYPIDQGIAVSSRPAFERLDLSPYVPAVRTHHVGTVMPSYSSVDWTEDGVGNPVKMHDNRELVQGWLKDRVGFDGFVISDYNGLHQIEAPTGELSPSEAVRGVNAGIDMAMEPNDFAAFERYLLDAVRAGRVSTARIDDAVSRILTKKFELGLFERPFADRDGIGEIGSAAHRAVARRAAAESQVLLKNAGDLLPLRRDARLYVAGRTADDLGNQAGGWTITWQGGSGRRTDGTTVLQGIRQVAPDAEVTVSPDASAAMSPDQVGVVVVGETPYSEGFGDVGGPRWAFDPSDAGTPREPKSLDLQPQDDAVVGKVCGTLERCVVLVVSGRPQVVTKHLHHVDALVASWLPGTEGAGVADVLFGRRPFTGQLPQTWPRSADQEPINVGDSSYAPLYPFGWGLRTDAPAADRADVLRSARAVQARGVRARAVQARAAGHPAGAALTSPGLSSPALSWLYQGLRLLVQDRVADDATGVPARAADRIARADREHLRGDDLRAVVLLLQALR
jgi:beta-glucosidase